MNERIKEPDWSESKTGNLEPWKSPSHSMADRLIMADGAIAFYREVINNLQQKLDNRSIT